MHLKWGFVIQQNAYLNKPKQAPCSERYKVTGTFSWELMDSSDRKLELVAVFHYLRVLWQILLKIFLDQITSAFKITAVNLLLQWKSKSSYCCSGFVFAENGAKEDWNTKKDLRTGWQNFLVEVQPLWFASTRGAFFESSHG